MNAQDHAAYMELVRETWLQCRGAQRVYAKAWLDRYDQGRKDKRNAIKHSLGCILLWATFMILVAMIFG